MKVLKFGGTSVGSAARMKAVAELINDGCPKIVVLSAMSGTTNNLVQISNALYAKKQTEATTIANELETKYYHVIDELYSTKEFKTQGKEFIKNKFDFLRSFSADTFGKHEENTVLAQGELLSTTLFQLYLQEIKLNSALIPALNFMRVDKNNEPDDFYIKVSVEREMERYPNVELFVTQGFICLNAHGEIDNLKRGGSDYSASIIGAAINATEIQIWTDISGIHNNDPRFVENTQAITELSFDEAAELAYFGAKILHPTSVLPAKFANIPVWLKNTMQPKDYGTLISNKSIDKKIKAVAAKDDIIAIKIKSTRMLLAYGFMRRVFEVFEHYQTPIDMITTSEIGVSLTIDNGKHLKEIVEELQVFGTVEVDTNQTIVCIVGSFGVDENGLASQIFSALSTIPIRMISYGASEHNVSVLLKTEHKKDALVALSKHLFS